MGITKYIGRIALLVLFGMVISGSSTHANALSNFPLLTLPGLTFMPTLLSEHTSKKSKPMTLQLKTSPSLLTINKTTSESLTEILALTTPTPPPKKQEEKPIFQQVFAAEITANEITETPSPTPTAAPKTQSIPPQTIQPTTNAGGLNPETLFSMVNSYRQSQNLAPFQKNDQVCALAAARAPEIAAEISSGHMHAGMYGRNLPYWNTENIISMNSEAGAFNWWINDGIHHAAIVGPSAYSCVACSGNACAEEFTSLQPK